MDFNNEQAIYLQIGDMIFEKILNQDWVAEERIPSVRELASSFEVNPNTIMRTYSYLQQEEIIYNQRGIGYFLGADALIKTRAIKRQQFLTKELPNFMKMSTLLDYTIEELTTLITNYKYENK
jgi:GntR family transcriptional regulator